MFGSEISNSTARHRHLQQLFVPWLAKRGSVAEDIEETVPIDPEERLSEGMGPGLSEDAMDIFIYNVRIVRQRTLVSCHKAPCALIIRINIVCSRWKLYVLLHVG